MDIWKLKYHLLLACTTAGLWVHWVTSNTRTIAGVGFAIGIFLGMFAEFVAKRAKS